MRILYIHQYFSTRFGSSGTRSYEFSKFLVTKGHSVTIITSSFALSSLKELKDSKFITRLNLDGINLIIINIKYSNYMNFFKRIWSFSLFMFFSIYVSIKQKNIDIVFTTSTPLTVGIPGIIFSRLKRVPFVFEVRDLWPDVPIAIGALKNKMLIILAKWIEKLCYREAKRIIVLSPGMLEFINQKGIADSKLKLIPNCSDLELFKPINKKNGFMKKKYFKDKFIAIHSGAMGFVNGLEIVIDVAKILKGKKINNIIFLLIGDGKERPKLVHLVKHYNLKNVLIRDPVSRNKLPIYLNIADLCLMLVRNVKIFETNSANKFFDYLSAGKPVLINYGGWMKKILEEYNAGISVEPDNPKAMAEVILKLSKNKRWCEEMGNNARKLAEEKFDRIQLAEELEELFYELMNEKNYSSTKKNQQTKQYKGNK